MEQLLKTVAEFAGKLGIEAARLWPEMVLAYWVKHLVHFALGPVLTVGLGVAAWKTGFRAAADLDDRTPLYAIIAVTCGVLAVGVGMGLIAEFGNNFTAVLWPEASLVLDAVGKK